MIPLCKPYINEKEFEYVEKVLKSGWLADGPINREFEKQFAEYIGVKHAVCMNSATSALFIVLKALDITGEVIIPSFTFSATANAIVTAGATPVFVDIDFKTGNIDVAKIKAAVTEKTQAIMPVHLAGQSCNMDALMRICREDNLHLIEDSAEAIGAHYKGRKTGSFGIGCFSFFPVKNMTTGEGGMLTTNDNALAQKIQTLVAHGIPRHIQKNPKKFWERSSHEAGYNFRLSSILAAIGLVQLNKLDTMNAMRQKNATYLNQNLDKENVEVPYLADGCDHVYQMYTIRVAPEIRDELVHFLREREICASVHFDPPVHEQKFYKGWYKSEGLEQTEKLARSIITLPMFPQMTPHQLEKITNTVNNFFQKNK